MDLCWRTGLQPLTDRGFQLLRNLIVRTLELLEKVRANGQEVDASECLDFSNLNEARVSAHTLAHEFGCSEWLTLRKEAPITMVL